MGDGRRRRGNGRARAGVPTARVTWEETAAGRERGGGGEEEEEEAEAEAGGRRTPDHGFRLLER